MNIAFAIISVITVMLSLLFVNSGHLSSVLFLTFYLLAGNLITTVRSNPRDKMNVRKIFNYSFCLYTVYMVLTNSIYVSNPMEDYFVYSDQTNFYRVSSSLGKMASVSSIYGEAKGIYFGIIQDSNAFGAFTLLGIIGLISENISGNNIIVQKLSIVFICSLMNVFLYLILSKRLHERTAKRAALLFASLSFLLFYSSLLLRDVHIMLFYTIGIYLISKKFSSKRLLFLYILFFVTLSFRKFSGMFFLSFPALYMYLNYSEKNMKYYIGFLVIIFVSLIITYYNPSEIWSEWASLSANMKNYTMGRTSSDALRLSFERLPFGLNVIVKSAFSQMQPFPFWGLLHAGGYPINERNVFRLPESIAGLFWFFVWVTSLYGVFNRKIRKSIPKIFLLLFYFGVAYILLNSVEINIRRNIAVHPAIYIVSVYSYLNISKARLRSLMFITISLYVGLNISYLVIAS
jgi:hypothetical protein